jgi:hypothetical protein
MSSFALEAPPFPALSQNDLQLQREKVRRKAAIVGRQEEELAARDKAAEEAAQRLRSLHRDLERATDDAGERWGGGCRLRPLCVVAANNK